MSGLRICDQCSLCGSPGATNAPGAVCVPEPRMWTTSWITVEIGRCSPIEATCRACATVAIAAKLQRKFTDGAVKTDECLGAPAWLHLRTGACGDLYRHPPRGEKCFEERAPDRTPSYMRDFFPTTFGLRGKIQHHGKTRRIQNNQPPTYLPASGPEREPWMCASLPDPCQTQGSGDAPAVQIFSSAVRLVFSHPAEGNRANEEPGGHDPGGQSTNMCLASFLSRR